MEDFMSELLASLFAAVVTFLLLLGATGSEIPGFSELLSETAVLGISLGIGAVIFLALHEGYL